VDIALSNNNFAFKISIDYLKEYEFKYYNFSEYHNKRLEINNNMIDKYLIDILSEDISISSKCNTDSKKIYKKTLEEFRKRISPSM
jgi:hypothetical protein